MILMKIQFILEAYVYRHGDKNCEKNVYGVFFWIGLTCIQVLMPLRGCKLLSETLESSV